jgi:hypothetical protein
MKLRRSKIGNVSTDTIKMADLLSWILLYLVLRRRRKERECFRGLLSAEGRRRRQRNLPRPSLLIPTASPWQQLYNSKDDAALITVTGFDHTAF